MLETKLRLGLKDQGRLLTDEEFAQAECDAPGMSAWKRDWW